MARPQVADGGDALQFWGVAVNILISSRGGQLTRNDPPAWMLGVGLTTPHSKKKISLLRKF
jgi:hypothetical protein